MLVEIMSFDVGLRFGRGVFILGLFRRFENGKDVELFFAVEVLFSHDFFSDDLA